MPLRAESGEESAMEEAVLNQPTVNCEDVPNRGGEYKLVSCRNDELVKYCFKYKNINSCIYAVNLVNLVGFPERNRKTWIIKGYAVPSMGGIPIHFTPSLETPESAVLDGREMLFEMGEVLQDFNDVGVLENLRREVEEEQERGELFNREGSAMLKSAKTVSMNQPISFTENLVRLWNLADQMEKMAIRGNCFTRDQYSGSRSPDKIRNRWRRVQALAEKVKDIKVGRRLDLDQPNNPGFIGTVPVQKINEDDKFRTSLNNLNQFIMKGPRQAELPQIEKNAALLKESVLEVLFGCDYGPETGT